MTEKRPLVWWHFSDLHWQVYASTERQTFLRALFEDLRKRVDQYGPPDFVLISGDISFSGEEAQFLDADEHFVQPLLSVIANENLPVFLVPGNHDLRRPTARTVNPDLVLSINSIKSLNEFLDSEELVCTVDRPFTAFEKFGCRRMPKAEWTTLGWWQELEIRGTTVRIVGVNSAWASSYHKTADGIADDERHLLLGQKQLRELMERSVQTDLSLFVLHHPLRWLNGFNEPHVRHIINRYADFVLFGHTHTLHDLSITLSITGTAVYLPSPAIYDRADTDTVEYARGYNIVTFDPVSRKGSAYYFKYSDSYTTKFSPFVEIYDEEGREGFSIDLTASKSKSSALQTQTRVATYSDALSEYPVLARLSALAQKSIHFDAIERHALEYFEAVILDLVRSTDILESDSADTFWEAAVLSRSLMAIDLQQLADSPIRAYRPRLSSDALTRCLIDARQDPSVALKLNATEYQKLLSLSVDTFSITDEKLSQISDLYRRLFVIPWLMSRLLLYCDYPELIPLALQSEGRIADLFGSVHPESMSILGYKFDAGRCLLSLDLRLRDRDGFLAVTMLKHYADAVLNRIADFWRSAQRVLPPLSITLEFPRWRNKQISDYYLTVETTPIVKLLMGKAMYRDAKHVWFRELVQNALDANTARHALDNETYRSELEITCHSGNVCVIRDNGIGMSRQHILRYLTTLGRSIWSSEELKDTKSVTRDVAIRAIGKFGIGFAAVFQDAKRVLVRTRFFREVGESGWLVDFASVEKPFLLEAIDTNIGTEVEVQLAEGIPQKAFLQLVNEFFLYIDEYVSITPDPLLPKRLSEVNLFPTDLMSRAVLRDLVSEEQIGAYRFTLRCVFCYDYRAREKDEKPPSRRLIVSNGGVRVFEQSSLILKPGKRYIWVSESEDRNRYESPEDSGLNYFWVVVDFDKTASPILPSRLEVEIDQAFSKELLRIVHERYCEGLRQVVQEISDKNLSLKAKRKAILTAMTLSTVSYQTWYDRGDKSVSFSRSKSIDDMAIRLYRESCPICIQTSDGQERLEPALAQENSPHGVFVVESVAKSSLFKVYTKATELKEWVLVEDKREFFLFSKVVDASGWKGFLSEKSLLGEGRRIFAEIIATPLASILRGDYAPISDDLFDHAAFIVLPSNLPSSWKRGVASASVRRDTAGFCPARVLVNVNHPLIIAILRFLENASTPESEKHHLKLLMENMCDSVIEQDRITVGRERWRSLYGEFREMLGGLPDINYETLVIRR